MKVSQVSFFKFSGSLPLRQELSNHDLNTGKVESEMTISTEFTVCTEEYIQYIQLHSSDEI